MPQPIAHYWVIENALNDVSSQHMSGLWHNHRNYAVVGALFPDIMYMSGAPYLAGMTRKKHSFDYSHISDIMHWNNFLDFYCSMLDQVKALPKGEKKDKLKAFIYGVASHFAADADVHPRVYSMTGDHPFHHPDKEFTKHKKIESLGDIVILGQRGVSYREFNLGDKFICHSQGSGRELDNDVFRLVMGAFEKTYAGKVLDGYTIDYDRLFRDFEGSAGHPLLEVYRDMVTLYRKFSKYSFLAGPAKLAPFIPQRVKVLIPRTTIRATELSKLNPDPRQKWVESRNENIPDLSFQELLNLAVTDTKAIIRESERFLDSDYTDSSQYFYEKSSHVPILHGNINLDHGKPTVWNEKIKQLDEPGQVLECGLDGIVSRYEWTMEQRAIEQKNITKI